jgi:hypothetical protein
MCSLDCEQVRWYNKFKVIYKNDLQWCWTLNLVGHNHVQINWLTADLKSCWMESMANIGAAWDDHSHSNSIILVVSLLPNSTVQFTSRASHFGDTFETLSCKMLFFSGCLFEYYFSTCKFCFFILPLVWGFTSVAFDQLFYWGWLRITENSFRRLLDIVCTPAGKVVQMYVAHSMQQ